MPAMPKVTAPRRSPKRWCTARMPAPPAVTRSSAVRLYPGPAPTRTFCFLPNPNLRPEVGKNKEARLQPEVRTTCSRRATASAASSTCSATTSLTSSIWLLSGAALVQPGRRLRRASRSAVPAVPEHRAGPNSRASKPRRCTTQVSGSSASPARTCAAKTCRQASGCRPLRRGRSRRRPAFGCSTERSCSPSMWTSAHNKNIPPTIARDRI